MAPWISTPWSSHFCLIPDLSFVSYCFFSVEYHLLWISLPEVGYSSLSTVYLCGSLNIRTSCKLLVLCLTSRVSQHSLISARCIFCDSICPGMKCTNDKINALIIDFLAWLVCIGPSSGWPTCPAAGPARSTTAAPADKQKQRKIIWRIPWWHGCQSFLLNPFEICSVKNWALK